MGKVYTLFQTKTGAKTLPFGAAHTCMSYPPGMGSSITIQSFMLL